MEERMKTIGDFLEEIGERNQRIETLLQQLQLKQLNNRLNREGISPQHPRNFGFKPKIEFPQFDGTNARLWIKKCNRYFELCKIPNNQRVDLASLYVVGKAKSWVRQYRAVWKYVDWDDFARDLRFQFKETIVSETIVSEEEPHSIADNMFVEMCVSDLHEKEAGKSVDQVLNQMPEPISHLNQVQSVQVDPVCTKTPLVEHPTPPTTQIKTLSSSLDTREEVFMAEVYGDKTQSLTSEHEAQSNVWPQETVFTYSESGTAPVSNDEELERGQNEVNKAAVEAELLKSGTASGELEGFEEDRPSTPPEGEQEVGLENKHQMSSKLRALDNPHFCNFMALGAEQERFCILRGVLHMADKLLLPDGHRNGNSTLKCPCLQVKNDSLMVLYALPSLSLVENVVLLSMLGNVDWFMGSSLSRILGFQANNTRVFESVVDRKTFLTFKELYSWGIQWA